MESQNNDVLSKSITSQIVILTVIRVILGYHFLYEGLQKLLIGSWTSAGYLLGSEWIISNLFEEIALNPTLLSIVDFLNIWGQIVIGIFLIIGLFTRYSAWAGAILLFLYYIANPPFMNNQIFINVILMEFLLFTVIALFTKSEIIGFDSLIKKDRKN